MIDNRVKRMDELLVELGACPSARYWAQGWTMAWIWKHCERVDWMLWLLHMTAGLKGFPSLAMVKKEILVFARQQQASPCRVMDYRLYPAWRTANYLLFNCATDREALRFLRSRFLVKTMQGERREAA